MSKSHIKPETINSVSVETSQGYKTFNLVHGDITVVSTDLLVLSTHGNPAMAPTGQVLNALWDRHGVTIDPNCHWLDFAEGRWTCFQRQPEPSTFSAILTVRIPSLQRQQEPLPFFDEAVRGVFASIAALEYMGHSFPIVSLSVLYGQRLIMEHDHGEELYPTVAESLIRHALHWLKKSDQTHTVQFVVFEEEQMAAWDEAMNKTMGRSLISAGSDTVLVSLCQEIIDAIRSRPDGRLAGAVVPLADALAHQDRLSIENVCVWGRKLVETMLVVLLPILQIKPGRDLASNIEALGKSKAVAPWIVSYMHSLRIFGNESVHAKSDTPGYHPTRLEKGDLVSALSAVRSLLAVWPAVAGGPSVSEYDNSH